jgi:hypothetical protein
MPAHTKAMPELSSSVQGALRIEVVIVEVGVSGNPITVQGFMSRNGSSEPWNGFLLVLMELHRSCEQQIGVIIGRIIGRCINKLHVEEHNHLVVVRHSKQKMGQK